MQIWPTELRDKVREIAGGRAVTSFTITAVQERLARIETGVEIFPPEEEESDDKKKSRKVAVVPDAPEPETPATPVAPEPEPEAEPEPASEPEPVPGDAAADEGAGKEDAVPVDHPTIHTRGETVDVQSVSASGVVAQFSSSASAVEDLMRRVQELGVKRGSELPSPVQVIRDEEPEVEEAPEVAEAVAEVEQVVEQVHVVTREEPEPVTVFEQPEPVVQEPEPIIEPVAPAPRPVVQRNLDDIEVDF